MASNTAGSSESVIGTQWKSLNEELKQSRQTETHRVAIQEPATQQPEIEQAHKPEPKQLFEEYVEKHLLSLRGLIEYLNGLKEKYPNGGNPPYTVQENQAYYSKFAGRVTEVLSFSDLDPTEIMWAKYEWLQEFANDTVFEGSIRAMRDDTTETPVVLEKFVTFVCGAALLETLVATIDSELKPKHQSGSHHIVTSDIKWIVNKYPEWTTKRCLFIWTRHSTNRLRAKVVQRLQSFTQLVTNEIASDPFQCIELLRQNGTQSWGTSAAFLLAENFELKETIKAQQIELNKLELPRECLIYRGCFEQLASRSRRGQKEPAETQREACKRFWDLKVDEAVRDRRGLVWDILETTVVPIRYPLTDTEQTFEEFWADFPMNSRPRYDDKEIQTKAEALKTKGDGIYARLSTPIHQFKALGLNPVWYSLGSGHWQEGELQILKALKALRDPLDKIGS